MHPLSDIIKAIVEGSEVIEAIRNDGYVQFGVVGITVIRRIMFMQYVTQWKHVE